MTGTGSQIGGLVGFNGGAVTGSTATGNVGGPGTEVGGLIGWNDGNATNVSNSGAFGSINDPSEPSGGGLIGLNTSTGPLTNNTYIDEPAVRAAFLQAARQAATVGNVVATTDTETTANNPPNPPAISGAGTGATNATSSPNVDDNITNEQRQRRRFAQTTPGTRRTGTHHGGNGNFGATIRSIEINGQRYNLQGGQSGH